MDHRPSYVAVIGAGDTAAVEHLAAAELVGRLLAVRGHVVVNGGLGGVMEAASRGAAGEGGTVVGLLPGRDRTAGNPHLTVALPTGVGELRNGLLVRAADGVVAVGGSWGTLSEVALAVRTGTPLVWIDPWELRDGDGSPPAGTPPRAADPAEAVALLDRLIDARG